LHQIKWLPEALANVARLKSFLHEISTDSVVRAAKAILDGFSNLLKNMPTVQIYIV